MTQPTLGFLQLRLRYHAIPAQRTAERLQQTRGKLQQNDTTGVASDHHTAHSALGCDSGQVRIQLVRKLLVQVHDDANNKTITCQELLLCKMQ